MKSKDIRKKFIEYFKNQSHKEISSSPLVPIDDNTLLFANAGMNQFKNLFIGLEKTEEKRAVSAQKCVRAGGKHNDLENVGFTARHHTFFEMLGNFSFGDYFKKEAIHYCFDFLTNELKIPKEKLYVTVHVSDDEAAEIWQKQEGFPKDRIFRFDKDNFWRMGDIGPCGPSSEVFYDHHSDGPKPKTAEEFETQSDRFVEIWNLVFMQYNEDENGRSSLPNPSIDTGCGLERLATVMQGKTNNYDTDLFSPFFATIEKLTSLKYKSNPQTENDRQLIAAMRVLADHSRATAFLIADGVLPSNEGRGYVLRRIMRRALRYGRKLSTNTSLMPEVCRTVIQTMGDFYPELRDKEALITSSVEGEEERFLQTLDQGTRILNEALKKIDGKTLPGELVFRLYDTYGFPVDLTHLMAAEQGFDVDQENFEKHMEQAREKARSSWKGAAASADQVHLLELSQLGGETLFSGYDHLQEKGEILALSNGQKQVTSLQEGEHGFLISNKTCFYAESGGQVGDNGELSSETAKAVVSNCTKGNNTFIHHIEVKSGELKQGQNIQLQINQSQRRQTAANHSATHLLHSALREVIGQHVSQAGSLVDPERLRFDFTHNSPLTNHQLQDIENWVNQEIAKGNPSQTLLTDPETAIQKEGALALFGEKYGDEVRVVKLGPLSTELCGGTHVANTAMIRLFIIVSESGVSSGIRRIEALSGDLALEYLNKHRRENLEARQLAGIQENWMKFLTSSASSSEFIESTQQKIKNLELEISSLKKDQVNIEQLIASASTFESPKGENGRLVAAQVEIEDRKLLSDITDKIKDKIQSGVVILIGQGGNTHPIIVSVTKNLKKELNAGQLLKEVAAEMGGKGGGRPDFAQGAVVDLEKSQSAFKKVEIAVRG